MALEVEESKEDEVRWELYKNGTYLLDKIYLLFSFR
jgi:hypothetical protein